MRRLCFLLGLVGFTAWSFIAARNAPAAEFVRFYTMGEDDDGAAKAKLTFATSDTVEFQETPDIGPFVTLEGAGTYVDGKDGPESFAIDLDGDLDFFESVRFDPRDFGGGFSALSQAWVMPDAAANGNRQRVWGLGNDNGGVAITDDGFWELISGGSAGSIKSPREVDFDEWSHVAVLRTGNNGFLYVNGSLVTTNGGFWNAPGTLVVGAEANGDDPFDGAIDDFIISGFGDGSGFELIRDVKFFDPDALSGVPGDVNQDSKVNIDDYFIWSSNVGFDNGLGQGDANTLFMGDVDQNGRVNYFDFETIRTEALLAGTPLVIPEPGSGVLVSLGLLSISCLFRKSRRRAV